MIHETAMTRPDAPIVVRSVVFKAPIAIIPAHHTLYMKDNVQFSLLIVARRHIDGGKRIGRRHYRLTVGSL
jgi:hypothetical protein